MRDLRPKLADDFIDAIVKDISLRRGFRQAWGSFEPSIQAEIKAAWKAAILERFVSHDIEFTGWEAVSCYHPDVVAAFRAKYPEIEVCIEFLQACALQVWPGAVFGFHLHSDPECGCITSETQHLVMDTYTGIGTLDSEDKDEWAARRVSSRKFQVMVNAEDSPYDSFEAMNLLMTDEHLGTETEMQAQLRKAEEDYKTRIADKKARAKAAREAGE